MEDLVDVTTAIDAPQFTLAAEILRKGGRLGLVDAQPVTDGLFPVISAMLQLTPAYVTAVLQTWGRGVDVVDLPARLTGPAAGQSLKKDLKLHIDQDGRLNGHPHGVDHRIQSLGLGNGPREAVQDETVGGIGRGQPLLDDPEHNFIADQMTRLHGLLGALPQRRTLPNGGTQQVTRGYLRHLVPFNQTLGLGALSGARRSKQYNSHLRVTPKPKDRQVPLLSFLHGGIYKLHYSKALMRFKLIRVLSPSQRAEPQKNGFGNSRLNCGP